MRSGRLSPSTRIIWNAFHTAIPATSFARTGNYPLEREGKVGREPQSSSREWFYGLTTLSIQCSSNTKFVVNPGLET